MIEHESNRETQCAGKDVEVLIYGIKFYYELIKQWF